MPQEILKERFLRLAKTTDAQELSAEGLNAAGIGLLIERLEHLSHWNTIKLIDFVGDIESFQKKFHQDYSGEPRILPKELFEQRNSFIGEEFDEWREACYEGDIVAQYDALMDLLFVVLGTLHMQGFPVKEGWEELVLSNMSKEYVLNGGKAGAGVNKGKDYKKPDFAKVLRDHKHERRFV